MIVNPGSIAIIDGIVCPSVAFQEAGGNCALGSDQAPGNNCHNIFNEMKNVALFNKIKFQNPEVMPAWRAPVSYTHLDVYKRQALQPGNTGHRKSQRQTDSKILPQQVAGYREPVF